MNWDLLFYLLENFSIVKKKNRCFTSADRILLLEETSQDLPDTVYLTEGNIPCPAFENALIIHAGRGVMRCSNYIVLEKGTLTQILNVLLNAKDHLDLLSRKLSKAMRDQEAIDIASAFLNVPLFYFDASYRVLAITKDLQFADDPEWEHMTEKGFLSLNSIRLMQESGDLDLLADKKEPFPYNASYFPFESLVCNIWNNGSFYSRMNMLCVHEPPNELHIAECRIICACLLRIALSSGSAMSYTGPLNSMVLDLLQGMQLSEELILDRLRSMPLLRESLIQVCCIEPNVRNDPQVLNYYSAQIGTMFAKDTVITLEYDGKIVLILHAAREKDFEPLYQKLSDLLEAQGMKCGTSNLFRRFSSLRDHYLQALKTLSLGKRTVGINHFRDHYFDYLLSFLTREQAISMISSDVLHLLRLQKDYQFPLTETLNTYLDCNCNLQMTAEKLYIHKNTALYRINHIKELLHADLEDAQLRMQLLFSFRVLALYPIRL